MLMCLALNTWLKVCSRYMSWMLYVWLPLAYMWAGRCLASKWDWHGTMGRFPVLTGGLAVEEPMPLASKLDSNLLARAFCVCSSVKSFPSCFICSSNRRHGSCINLMFGYPFVYQWTREGTCLRCYSLIFSKPELSSPWSYSLWSEWAVSSRSSCCC
jgi:hypothetical protein